MVASIGFGPVTEEQVRFYAALGWANSQWQHVEDNLGELFASLIGANHFPALAAFHSVATFRAQLDMVHSAAQMKLRGKLFRQWRTLHDKIGRKNIARNELVHWTIIHQLPPDSQGNSIFLGPSPRDMKAFIRYGEKSPRYSAKQIIEKSRSFNTLSMAISKFSSDVGTATKQPPD